MNWTIWTRKLLINGALVIVPLVIAALEEAKAPPDSPPWVAMSVAGALVITRQIQNWLKHRTSWSSYRDRTT